MDIERIRSGLIEAAKIADGYRPVEADLAGAPLISGWILDTDVRGMTRLVGSVTGHPVLGERDLISTSVVLAMSVTDGWARTVSRYYLLGPATRTNAD